MHYRIAGNFGMVEIFVQKCQYVLRHYAELYESLNYEIFKWVVHTKICTNEYYPLYGMQRNFSHRFIYGLAAITVLYHPEGLSGHALIRGGKPRSIRSLLMKKLNLLSLLVLGS